MVVELLGLSNMCIFLHVWHAFFGWKFGQIARLGQSLYGRYWNQESSRKISVHPSLVYIVIFIWVIYFTLNRLFVSFSVAYQLCWCQLKHLSLCQWENWAVLFCHTTNGSEDGWGNKERNVVWGRKDTGVGKGN